MAKKILIGKCLKPKNKYVEIIIVSDPMNSRILGDRLMT